MEFKTKKEYDNFIKGNEQHFSNKIAENKFKLFTCKTCLSHFDNKKERDEHEQIHSGWVNHPSANLKDEDFKDGGAIIETLICDLCGKEKTDQFKHVTGGFVFCSKCTGRISI